MNIQMLKAAAQDFIDKCDRGEARSTRTYNALKQALAAPDDEVVEALQAANECFDKALPKFNWGASFLDAEAIRLLNNAPVKVKMALESLNA